MCQCLLCDCCWWNICGANAGFAYLLCCAGFWCCQPAELESQKKFCCLMCESSGLGSSFFCLGSAFCAPQWLQNYSKNLSAKKWFNLSFLSFLSLSFLSFLSIFKYWNSNHPIKFRHPPNQPSQVNIHGVGSHVTPNVSGFKNWAVEEIKILKLFLILNKQSNGSFLASLFEEIKDEMITKEGKVFLNFRILKILKSDCKLYKKIRFY